MKGGYTTKSVALMAVAMMVVMMVVEVQVTKAVTCSAIQLSPCLEAITKSQKPTAACCNKLREQKPCLCGYIKDPNLKKYVNSPGARNVARACGVTINC